MLQVFQLFRTYVVSVSSRCCKSRSGVAHIAMGPICRSCRGTAEPAEMVPAYGHAAQTGESSMWVAGTDPVWVRQSGCSARNRVWESVHPGTSHADSPKFGIGRENMR
jgi:hypothetical protein